MPLIMCYTRAGLDVDTKAKLAAAITEKVNATIKSDYYHISVIFSDLASESSYVAGVPSNDTIIVCNIRLGRTDAAIQALSKGMSQVWNKITGHNEDRIEVTVQEFKAKFVVRGGKQMPEPPFA